MNRRKLEGIYLNSASEAHFSNATAPAQARAQDVEPDRVCLRVRAGDDPKRDSERQGRAERNSNSLKLGCVSDPNIDEIAVRLARVA